jgi:hypothetical protein
MYVANRLGTEIERWLNEEMDSTNTAPGPCFGWNAHCHCESVYPSWTKGGSAIVYHAGGKLFLFTLAAGSTQQVSIDNKADYRYPHGEAMPN